VANGWIELRTNFMAKNYNLYKCLNIEINQIQLYCLNDSVAAICKIAFVKAFFYGFKQYRCNYHLVPWVGKLPCILNNR